MRVRGIGILLYIDLAKPKSGAPGQEGNIQAYLARVT